jgi:hypothetical protein
MFILGDVLRGLLISAEAKICFLARGRKAHETKEHARTETFIILSEAVDDEPVYVKRDNRWLFVRHK